VQRGQRGEHRAQPALHVDAAAAPHASVDDLPGERIDGPSRGVGGNGVEVADHEDVGAVRRRVARRDVDVAAPVGDPFDARGQAPPGGQPGQRGGHGVLVAGRVLAPRGDQLGDGLRQVPLGEAREDQLPQLAVGRVHPGQRTSSVDAARLASVRAIAFR
jgi:hypothetical protein